ncbi:hypothetical protein C8Q74DRAFT_100595 [Fomes fomentarius]|nr:hypothetical protein C8Q74DRAFT_100595 [Fomes fomentarius]
MSHGAFPSGKMVSSGDSCLVRPRPSVPRMEPRSLDVLECLVSSAVEEARVQRYSLSSLNVSASRPKPQPCACLFLCHIRPRWLTGRLDSASSRSRRNSRRVDRDECMRDRTTSSPISILDDICPGVLSIAASTSNLSVPTPTPRPLRVPCLSYRDVFLEPRGPCCRLHNTCHLHNDMSTHMSVQPRRLPVYHLKEGQPGMLMNGCFEAARESMQDMLPYSVCHS